jgi:hypothetical protein
MVLKTQTNVLENGNEDSVEEHNIEVDAEVDIEGEIICSLN